MVRRLSLAIAAALLSTVANAQQAPMHDTWDINAPNGALMMLGKPLPSAAASAVSGAPMQDTWDINAPNGDLGTVAATAVADRHVHGIEANTAAVDRVIEIQPDTRYVNVRSGETVLF